MTDERLEIWRQVYDAYWKANPPNHLPGHATKLGALAADWAESRDPSHMDAAISYCYQERLPILPELLEHVHAAMQKRLRDGQSGNKAFRQGAKAKVFEKMAKYLYHGATLKRAAELGAYIANTSLGLRIKASTLEKEYPKHREEYDAFARMVFEIYPAEELEALAESYREVIDSNISVPQEILGERR